MAPHHRYTTAIATPQTNNMDEVNPMINEDAGIEETPQLRTEPPAFDPTAVITTKRRVQVKLTGDKMMDPERGLPHLMKIGKKRLHISKNKSSYENLSNIVQVYQLWAHQLYPKAKFNDFIKLSQQLGKSDKTLREYRGNVIRQELGLEMVGEEDVNPIITTEQNDTITTSTDNNINSHGSDLGNADDEIIPHSNRRNVFVPEDDSDDDNLYSFANSTAKPIETVAMHNGNEDEIQRLEAEQSSSARLATTVIDPRDEEIEEDEDALDAMRDDTPTQEKDKPQEINLATSSTSTNATEAISIEEEIRKLEEEQFTNVAPKQTRQQENEFDDEFEEDEDAMDAMRDFDM